MYKLKHNRVKLMNNLINSFKKKYFLIFGCEKLYPNKVYLIKYSIIILNTASLFGTKQIVSISNSFIWLVCMYVLSRNFATA